MDYFMGFCSVYNEKGQELDLSRVMALHERKRVRQALVDKHFDIPAGDLRRRNRMLDTRDQGFEFTDKGLTFKHVKAGECDFLDKSDGEVYHLIVLQG